MNYQKTQNRDETAMREEAISLTRTLIESLVYAKDIDRRDDALECIADRLADGIEQLFGGVVTGKELTKGTI